MTTEEKLLGLLRESLFGVAFDGDICPEEGELLIELADKQAVTGIVIDSLFKKNVRMGQRVVLQAFSHLEQIKQNNKWLNREVAVFARLMADTKTDYIVIKGQTLATLYPEPLVRMPGDIDFLVKDYQHAASALKENWGIDLPIKMKEKEVAFSHGNALYELHTYLINFGSDKHKRCWEKALARSKPTTLRIGNEEVKVMEPTLYCAYVFLHLFFHFVHEGVGLRHLCDWAMIMYRWYDEIEKERLVELLENVGMLKAFLAFGSILVDNFGLKTLPLPLTKKERKWQSMILKDVMQGGNFGRENRKAKQIGLRYKAETMFFTLRNSLRYFSLAPTEMLLLPYRRMVVNLKLIVN